MRRVAAVLVAARLATSADFECTQTTASAGFEAIVGTPQTEVLDISATDDGLESVDLGFAFPWFSATYSSIFVSSNGEIYMPGSRTVRHGDARPVAQGNNNFDRIAVCQADLMPNIDPNAEIIVLRKPESIVISYELMPFFPGSFIDDPRVSAQVELFSSGDVEIRWGELVLLATGVDGDPPVSIAAGLASDELRVYAPVQASGFSADGTTSAGSYPENFVGARIQCAEVATLEPSLAPSTTLAPTERYCGDGFSAAYAEWTIQDSRGTVDMSEIPLFCTMVSPDDGEDPLGSVSMTRSVIAPGTLAFDWEYVTADVGGAIFDPFSVILGAQKLQLSDDTGEPEQHGNFSAVVAQGDIIGFEVATFIDSSFGAATVTISNFAAPPMASCATDTPSRSPTYWTPAPSL